MSFPRHTGRSGVRLPGSSFWVLASGFRADSLLVPGSLTGSRLSAGFRLSGWLPAFLPFGSRLRLLLASDSRPYCLQSPVFSLHLLPPVSNVQPSALLPSVSVFNVQPSALLPPVSVSSVQPSASYFQPLASCLQPLAFCSQPLAFCSQPLAPSLLSPSLLAPELSGPRGYLLRCSLASMHSVACGTFISRSLGISLPVVLQIP